MKVLNLYAGLGGNRKLWSNVDVTAVEMDPKIAAVYERQHPDDTVIIGDAHEYLREHYHEFDFIWSSPPCQTHSRMVKATRHKNRKFPCLQLYEEILFLQHFFKGVWVVENVVPFYVPLIVPTKQVGRHVFWASSNFDADDVPRPKNFIKTAGLAGKDVMMEWLGIHYDERIYYGTNQCVVQILRNCVHPKLGKQIFDALK